MCIRIYNEMYVEWCEHQMKSRPALITNSYAFHHPETTWFEFKTKIAVILTITSLD